MTDSNGDRVLEVAENGTVVWQSTVGFPYESERLGTGDESAGGQSAASLDLSSRSVARGDVSAGPLDAALPPKLVNSISYALPRWVGLLEGVALVVLLGSLLGWGILEYRWQDRRVSVRSPVDLDTNDRT
ncbi:hypothetical protein VB773_09295 [Haloarculaceae archaeon H-GB2-1]|nr:hypothetical protein [Haloarculaceae archaeon H-GB2-1]